MMVQNNFSMNWRILQVFQNLKLSLLLLLSSVLLTSCGSIKTLEIFSSPVEKKIIQPADPRPVKLELLKFDVVTSDNIDEFLAEVKKAQKNDEYVFYAISPKNFEVLALNMQEIKRFIMQQQDIIIYYKKATAWD